MSAIHLEKRGDVSTTSVSAGSNAADAPHHANDDTLFILGVIVLRLV